MPWLPVLHDQAAARWWVVHLLLPRHRVVVADDGGGRPLGFAALDGDWLQQLYVDPNHQDAGVGRALLEDAKRSAPGGLRLHVFTRNTRARRFYEAAGFDPAEQSDGSANEDPESDCTYAWAGADEPGPGPTSLGRVPLDRAPPSRAPLDRAPPSPAPLDRAPLVRGPLSRPG